MRCLRNLEFGHYGGRKNKVLHFFHSKTHFQPILTQNTQETLLNQSMPTKNPINHPKTRNPLETKILPELRHVFLGNKTPKCNPPYHMKPFDVKAIVLVVVIFLNCHFLSLSRNLTTPSLSLKRLKKRKIKLGTKMYFLKIQET
jgi:hypothetical protein